MTVRLRLEDHPDKEAEVAGMVRKVIYADDLDAEGGPVTRGNVPITFTRKVEPALVMRHTVAAINGLLDLLDEAT